MATMPEHGPYRFTVTEDDAARALQVALRKRLLAGPSRWLVIAIVVFAVLLVVLDLLDGSINVLSTGIAVLGLPIVFLFVRLMAPRIARRQYRQSAGLRSEITMHFSAEAIRFETDNGAARLPLADLFGHQVIGDLLLLYQNEAFYNIVPQRALGEDWPRLLDAIGTAGLKKL